MSSLSISDLSSPYNLAIDADMNFQAGALTNPTANITPDTSPRGIKRSRSPDTYGDLPPGDSLGDDGKHLDRANLAICGFAFVAKCYTIAQPIVYIR